MKRGRYIGSKVRGRDGVGGHPGGSFCVFQRFECLQQSPKQRVVNIMCTAKNDSPLQYLLSDEHTSALETCLQAP